MEQLSSLYNPGFVGSQFNWWLGQVADSSTWRENMSDTPIDKKEDIPGWGYRYKVRIMGLHDGGESVIPSDQLPWAQVMYSVWGGGQGGSFQTPGIKEGMFVFGFFLDGSDEQVPIIMGVLGNNAKTTIENINSKVGVDSVTDESSVFEPRSGFTDDGTTDTSDNQICQQGANSTVTFESGDGTLLKTISDKIQVDVQNEEHPVECPKTKNSLTSLNTHMSNFQVEYQKLLEQANDFPTAAASKDINESIDKLIEKTAGFSAKSMLTTLNNQQTFLLEKLNDATAILEQEDNITNRLNLLEKNLEGQGKLACVFGKIKGDLADLIGAAMKKNLNKKNSAPPAGTYNPSNPCETEEIVADVMSNTQEQVRGGFMDALKSIAGGQGVPSLGRLGTAFNKLDNLNIPSELDVASLLPSFDQSLDVGGLLGKLPPIGGFDVGQELSFDMALANTFISSVAAFTECDPPEECPETDTLTLGGDQDKKSVTDPVNTDNIAKLNSEKLIEKAKGGIPKVGDVVQLNDGTKQYYTGVKENEEGELILNNEDEKIKYVKKPPTTFDKPIVEKSLVIEKSVDVEKINENETKITKTVVTTESSTVEGTIKQGVVVGGDSNPNAARITKLTIELLNKDKDRREARRYGDKDKVERLKQEIEIIKKEIRELRKKL
tara:strand:- start:2677 stop:4665 length:1989 start_codon:yes stop_codon:yes gene_type:complete